MISCATMMLFVICLPGIKLLWLGPIRLGNNGLILSAMIFVIVLYTTEHKLIGRNWERFTGCGTFGIRTKIVSLIPAISTFRAKTSNTNWVKPCLTNVFGKNQQVNRQSQEPLEDPLWKLQIWSLELRLVQRQILNCQDQVLEILLLVGSYRWSTLVCKQFTKKLDSHIF